MTQAEYDRWMDTRCALRAMVDAFKPFRSKPMGAPNSDARQEQEMQIAAYDYAVTVLSLPVKPSTTALMANDGR